MQFLITLARSFHLLAVDATRAIIPIGCIGGSLLRQARNQRVSAERSRRRISLFLAPGFAVDSARSLPLDY